MHAKGGRHEMVEDRAQPAFPAQRAGGSVDRPETTLRLDPKTLPGTGFLRFPARRRPGTTCAAMTCILAVEVSDTSLAYDSGRKIGIYAAFGIPEVWVIDANSLVTRVHRHLGAEGFRTVFEAGADEEIAATRAPQVAMCLARLGLKPL